MAAAEGSKKLVRDVINLWKIKKGSGALILKKLTDIWNVLEDVYSVGTLEELQSAIDQIGTGSGTIFIESGTYDILTTIDIDNCGSLVIYGHGDNTILRPADGITVFNITCCASLLVKTLRIDASNYTVPSINVELVIVDETNDNVVAFSDVSFTGVSRGRGFDLISENCIIENCNINLLSYGILLTGDHQLISQNRILSCEIGIYGSGDYHTITENTCNSNTNLGIYVVSNYSNVSNNTCNSNPTGISINGANYNTIANNTCSLNTFHGIRTILSSYNTISGNNCSNNDSNSPVDTAGIYIDANCDYNTISANSCNNNNNAGAGDGFGIIISAATCNENVIAANNFNGNDIDVRDVGTLTVIKYYVQDVEELQDAIDSIGTRAGTIIINLGTISITATVNINGNGDYIIMGEGDGTILTPSGDFPVFNLTIAKTCIFKNFKIDAQHIVGNNTNLLGINEVSDNPVQVENITIEGDADKKGEGIDALSNNVTITNCRASFLYVGIYAAGQNSIVEKCITTNNAYGGILSGGMYTKTINNLSHTNDGYGIRATGDLAVVIGNTCYSNLSGGIEHSGVLGSITSNILYNNIRYGINSSGDESVISLNIVSDNDYNSAGWGAGINIEHENCTITGNLVNWNNNTGAGITYGIRIGNAADNCIVSSNRIHNNEVDYIDNAVGTRLFGDDTVYGAGWLGDLGTPTKNAVYNQMQLYSLLTHRHDTHTLQLDGINSDGGAFPFITTGAVSFNQRLFLLESDDVDLGGISGGLIVGGDGSGQHIAIDGNEIMAKSDPTTAGTLNLQNTGGFITVGTSSFASHIHMVNTKAIYFGAGTDGDWQSCAFYTDLNNDRLIVRAEETNDIFQFTSYGGYFPRAGQAYNLYCYGGLKVCHGEIGNLDIGKGGSLYIYSADAVDNFRAYVNNSYTYFTGTQPIWSYVSLYVEADVRTYQGGYQRAYSVGNDKRIEMFHDDTRGWLATPSGDGDIRVQPGGTYLYVYPLNGVGGYVRFSAAAGWLTMFGSNDFYVDSNNKLYLKADSNIVLTPNHASGVSYTFTNLLAYPSGHKTEDFGMVFNAFDEAYADNWNNVGARYIEKAGLYERYKNMEIVPHNTRKTSVGDIEIDTSKFLTEITQPDRYEKQYVRKFVGYVAEILKRPPEEVDDFVRENYINREDCPDDIKDNWRPRPEDLSIEDLGVSLNQWIVVNSIVLKEAQDKIEALENRIIELENPFL